MSFKSDLIDQLVSDLDLTKKQAGEAVDGVFGKVADTLAAGERVQVPGFGTFSISERAEREGRNPATGATMTIAASKAVRFKPGKNLKDAVNA